ncbi:MAG: hypothetical protein ACREOM_00400 [Candidatus Dormibacteraceae bacterium]
MGSSPDAGRRLARHRFEEFVRHVLAVPKVDLDARLAAEKRRKRKKPPSAN